MAQAVPGSTEFTGAPLIYVIGGFAFGPQNNNDQVNKIFNWEFADTLNLVRGRHQIRVGADFAINNVTRIDDYLTFGSIGFLSFPDFLLGMSSAQNGTPYSNVFTAAAANGLGLRHPRFRNYAAFVQDDLAVTPRLTLNLGMRYQFNGNQFDTQGRDGGFFPNLIPPGYVPPPTGSFEGFVIPQNAQVSSLPPGVTRLKRNNLIPNNYLGFSPRIGLAWRPFAGSNFVVRSGYGIFWSAVAGTITEQDFFDPWYIQENSGGSIGPASTFQNPYVPGAPPTSAFPMFGPYFLNNSETKFLETTAPNMPQPYNQNWSLDTQYGLKGWVFDVGYVGSKSTHLMGYFYPNQALLATPQNPVNGLTQSTVENINFRTPVLGFAPTGLIWIGCCFDASYNSLQAAVQRQVKNTTLLVSYTWSHSIDDLASNFGGRNQAPGQFAGDNTNFRSYRGNSDFDLTQRLSISYSVSLPSFQQRFARILTQDWTVSGITTAQSGFPFSITSDIAGSIYGVNPELAQYAPGMSTAKARLSGSTTSRLNHYFNTAAFTDPGPINDGYGFGNVGRNTLRGPGVLDFDFAIARKFPVRESKGFTFKAEAFNLFNHPIFGNPGGDVDAASTFGVISSTVSNPRILQLALRFDF